MFPTIRQYVDASACDISWPRVSNLYKEKKEQSTRLETILKSFYEYVKLHNKLINCRFGNH